MVVVLVVVAVSFMPLAPDFWTHLVLSNMPGVLGIVAVSSVSIHLFFLHKKKGRPGGTCI